MEKEQAKGQSILDKSIDFIFSKDIRKYLIIILILGVILRFYAVSNITTIADEMIHGVHSIDIIKSGVINHQNESPAWSYLTDIAYKIFGVNAFSSRFLSFFFGSLTILLVYLLGKEIFNEKIGVLASFFLAISSYHLRYALMEMDEALIFFLLLGFYFFIKEFKISKKISYLSVLFFGVSILIKPISLPYIASFVLCIIYYFLTSEERKEIIKKNKKRTLYSILILFAFTLPILAYNYILYKQKGIVDVIFSRFLGINQDIYAGLQGYDKSFVLSEIFTLAPKFIFETFIKLDPILFVFGILGIIYIIFDKNYKSGRGLLLFHLVPLLFLMGTSLLQTHFVPFTALLSITSAVFVFSIIDKFKIKSSVVIPFALIIMLISNLFIILPYISSRSAMFNVRDFAVSDVQQNDIVVADGRIYRGRIAWTFNDKNYIEASLFPQLMEINNNLTSRTIQINLYYVECAADDCGWGTIKDQPEFNQSMEDITSFFKTNSQAMKVFNGGGGIGEDKGPYIVVYKSSVFVHPEIYPILANTHDWFYYPVRWAKNDWYDKYTPDGLFQELFNNVGKFMLWAAVILALLSPLLILRELFAPQKSLKIFLKK
jgi:4-amino-4-deoxy-L-arabinose transferase-like glycosyltransferase